MRRQRLSLPGLITDDFPRNANRQDCEDSPLCNRLLGLCAAFPDLPHFRIFHRSLMLPVFRSAAISGRPRGSVDPQIHPNIPTAARQE